MRLVQGLCLWMVTLFLLTHAARVALLIGNSDGGSEATPLRFVERDVKVLQETLANYCGFKKEHIITLLGKGPNDVRQALDHLELQLPPGEENILFLYYTGHADRDALKMGENRFLISQVKEQFSAFPAAIRIGVFDACQSGCFTRLKGGKLAEPFLFRDTGNIKGEVILSSSSPTENAQESDLLGNSVFTFYFVNALRGSGDFSGDGRVTLAEAYQYTYNRTVASTSRTFGGVQHPSYQFRIQGEGDVVLSDLTTSENGVLLENSIDGAVAIFDAFDNSMADFTKERSSRIIIALQPGEYQVVVTEGNGQKWKKMISVPKNRVIPLQLCQLEKMTTASSLRKGKQNGVKVGIGGCAQYSTISLNASQQDFKRMFQGFWDLGIEPEFIGQGGGLAAGIEAYIALSKRIVAVMEFTQWHNAKHSEYHGGETGMQGAKQFAVDLFIDEIIGLKKTQVGIQWNLCRGLFLQTGICWFTVDHRLLSRVYRELYDFSSENLFTRSGSVPVFYGGGGYTLHLSPMLAISFEGSYRQQSDRKVLSYSENESGYSTAGVSYRLRGFDISLGASFTYEIGGN